MTWVLEGFDRRSKLLVDRIELEGLVEEVEISLALDDPPDIQFAMWPVNETLLELLALRLGRPLPSSRNDYFVEFQVELSAES
jgi:hypothetical protein